MIHLDEQVSARVVVEQVSRDARALRHPVQPESAAGPVDVVAADLDINGAVELDARHLRAREQPPDVDVVDGVAGDDAEGGAQAADDARLFAVGDGVVADDVVADGFLVPAVCEGALDRLDVALGAYWPTCCPTRRRICPARCPSRSSG